MPGGQPQVLSTRFKGLNRLLANYMLDAGESPDTADAAAYLGQSQILGPRAGRKPTSNFSLPIRGVIPLNLSWGRIRLVADSGGNVTPAAVPWPSGPVAPTGACGCDLGSLGSATSGNISPGGLYSVWFMMVASNGTPGTSLNGLQAGALLDPTIRIGWAQNGALPYVSSYQDAYMYASATPDSLLITGYLASIGPVYWEANYAGYTQSNGSSITITMAPMDNGILINGVSKNRGQLVTVTGAPGVRFTVGS